MEHVGIDVHAGESQICSLTDEGEILERRIRTRPDRFEEVFGRRPRARILIEASTESEWVARCLEELGHEVIVADPNYAPMYATRSRRVKTDRRDAQALMDACRLGAYRPAHRTSDPQCQVRAELAVRDALVRTRGRFISLIRALLRRQGLRVRTGMARCFPRRLAELKLPQALSTVIAPLLAVMETLSRELDAVDARLARHAEDDPVVRRLQTVPNIGPVTALSFVATLDRVERFRGPHPAAAYLGLVPGERSSGERQHRGPITKRAMAAPAGSWSRPPGASSATPIPTPPSCAPGRPASPAVAVGASARSHWRGGSPGSCTRCGATAPTTSRST